jgi:hypothetical protein
MSEYVMGVDLGRQNDYTAVVIIEAVVRPLVGSSVVKAAGADTPLTTIVYDVRHIERMQLGMTYPDIVDRVKALYNHPVLRGSSYLVVDATGVGVAVVDMMSQANLFPVAVTITAGHDVAVDEYQRFSVPKRDLVTNLQVLLQSNRLRIAKELHMASDLTKELANFEVSISTTGKDSYGVWRNSQHDDLVLATALAAWYSVYIGAGVERAKPYRVVAGWENDN